MTQADLEKIIKYIVNQSVKLKNKYVDKFNVKIEFADIFSQNNDEYQKLSLEIGKLGKKVYTTPTGSIYLLKKPINTAAGNLYLVKIRKPDSRLKYRGDADFDTDYVKLKQKLFSSGNTIRQSRDSRIHPNFELIIRDKFEMLRLSDSEFDVMTCFSNIPVRKWIDESN